MIKPSLTFTLDRRVQVEGQEPIRLAVTLNAWTTREQADVDEQQVKTALAKASAQISAEVFGDVLPQLKESCGDCRFWQPDHSDSGDSDGAYRSERGSCLRHSPVRSESGAAPAWPVVYDTHWCGDFARGERPTP